MALNLVVNNEPDHRASHSCGAAAGFPKPRIHAVPDSTTGTGAGRFAWSNETLPAGLTKDDLTRITEAIAAGRAPSTRKTYASAWRRFERWCTRREITALPATPATACAYFAQQGVASGTIEGSCAAIAAAHGAGGHPNPVADDTVKAVRRGIRRILGTAPKRQSRPLNTAEIRQILTGIDRTTVKGIRDAAVILLGFAPALRRSELADLDLADLEPKPDGLLIHIRRSKGDPEKRGQVVGVAPGTHRATDPIAALDDWLAIRGVEPGRLFLGVRQERLSPQPFTGSGLARMLKDRAAAVGLPSERISGHSL